MKVIFNGIELNMIGGDHNIELNVTEQTKEFGMNAVVVFNAGTYEGETVEFNNCTEIHLYYNEKYRVVAYNDYDVAFESDIHGTGSTRRSTEIESITITTATKKEDRF